MLRILEYLRYWRLLKNNSMELVKFGITYINFYDYTSGWPVHKASEQVDFSDIVSDFTSLSLHFTSPFTSLHSQDEGDMFLPILPLTLTISRLHFTSLHPSLHFTLKMEATCSSRYYRWLERSRVWLHFTSPFTSLHSQDGGDFFLPILPLTFSELYGIIPTAVRTLDPAYTHQFGRTKSSIFFFFATALPSHSGPRPLIQLRNHFSQTVGLLGRVTSLSQGHYVNTGQHKQNKRIHTPNIHVLSGIRTHDPSVRASEDSSCITPRGDSDLH
jgi:hypothetical protein